MAKIKYMSLERLTEYDGLIKNKMAEDIAAAVSDKADSSDIPTGALADKDVISESDLDSALAEKVNAASEGNHSHSNKTVLDGITSAKVSAWDSAEANAKSYTDTKTDGMATTTVVENKVSTHNTSDAAHSDIRGLISALSTKVNNFLDVDDTTTDQLSEVLTLINNNKGTLESLTSSKVNVSDIIDNLTTSDATKVLSAKQGVALKALIDALEGVVNGKAAAEHDHAIDDVTGLQDALDGKAASSHGTHVEYSTTAPVMDGTASAGTAATVARSDHQHPVDTTRASKSEFDSHTGDTTAHITATERTNWNAAKTHADSAHAPSGAQANVIESIKVNGAAQTITNKAVDIIVPTDNKDLANGAGYLVASDISNKADKATTLAGYGITDAASKTHTHEISEVTGLQTALTNASNAISANTSSIEAHTGRIDALESKVGDGFEEITSAEVQALFNS